MRKNQVPVTAPLAPLVGGECMCDDPKPESRHIGRWLETSGGHSFLLRAGLARKFVRLSEALRQLLFEELTGAYESREHGGGGQQLLIGRQALAWRKDREKIAGSLQLGPIWAPRRRRR